MMEKSNRVVPKMRFKEFEGLSEWPKYKLADYADFRRGSFPQPYGKSEWYDGSGSMPFVQVVDVGSNLKLVDKTKQKISVLAQPKSIFVRKNTVVVTLQGSIGRVAITQYDSYLDRTLLIFQSYKEKTDKRFWAYTIQQKFNTEKEKAPGGTIKTITKESLSNFEVFIPTYDEQQKIGHFFEKIDKMIQLQQSKVNKVKDIKSAYLSEMFPKEGEKYPKKRFEGFTKPWEEYKMKDMGRSLTGLSGKSKKDFGHGEAEFVTYMNVFNNPIAKSTQTAQVEVDENQTEVEYGDIFFTVSSETPNEVGMSSVWLYNRPNVYLNSFCFGFRPTINLNPYYMAYMLRSPEIRKRFILLAQGISRYNISKTKAMELLFPIPSNEEQEKIGHFFKNLDNQISIEEEKLAKLEKLKQAYLNDMFV